MNTIEYSDDFADLELNRFWSTKRINPGRWSFVNMQSPVKTRALKITLEAGDRPQADERGIVTERSEISESKENILPFPKEEVWYGFSFFIPVDFKVTTNRLVFAQWKQDASHGESPVMALRYVDGKVLFTVQNNADRKIFEVPAIQLGTWHKILVSYQIPNGYQGKCQAFLDGVSFASYSGTMGYENCPQTAYFKMGLYRDHVPHADTIYLGHLRRGTSRQFCEK